MKITTPHVTKVVDFITFPGMERMPKIPCFFGNQEVTIQKSINTPQDLFDVAMVVNALRQGKPPTRLCLRAPYIFGARQDRICNTGEPMTAQVVAQQINALNLDSIYTFYPHSDVLPALINNCHVDNDISQIIKLIFSKTEQIVNIVAPDSGAVKRAFSLTKKLNGDPNSCFVNPVSYNYIECGKKRDVTTGKISDFTCDSKDLQKRTTIVVDDICANGGTFLGLHKLLKERRAGHTILFVAHADCFEGLYKCAQEYDEVYTTNSRTLSENDSTENITILNTFDL